MVAVRVYAGRDSWPHELLHHVDVIATGHREHEIDQLAALLFGVLDRRIERDPRRLGNGLDDRLFGLDEREAGVSTCEVVPRPRQDVVRDVAILGTPFDLDAGPAAGRVAELLSLLVDAGVLATGPIANSERSTCLLYTS